MQVRGLSAVISVCIELLNLRHQRIARVGGGALVGVRVVRKARQVVEEYLLVNAALLDGAGHVEACAQILDCLHKVRNALLCGFARNAEMLRNLGKFLIRNKGFIFREDCKLRGLLAVVGDDIGQQDGVRAAVRDVILTAELWSG